MENREKMFCFTAAVTNSSLKMPQTSSYMKPAAVTITPNQSDYFEFHQQQQQQEQQLQHYSVSSTTNDPYATYTDNFDLSLLPQDCAANGSTIKKASSSQIPADTAADIPTTNLVDNIPTTVFNFDTNREEQQSQLLTVPDIKIEQTWSSCPSLNTVKQEQIYQSYFPKQNQLIPPPPAYPVHIYPSPQSSPAQSEYGFPQSQYSGCYESLGSSRNSLCGTSASSPCPSIDVHSIKQEQLHILPPSPPESSCDTPTPQSGYTSASGFDFKSEPFDSDAETFNDLNTSSPKTSPGSNTVSYLATADTSLTKQDHQLLREYLEDTTFQKQHNLKPLALDSFIGDLNEVRDNFEPVISLALEHAKREADATCAKLQISQDPSNWSPTQVQAWLRSTIQQFDLPSIDDLETKFNENGTALLQLTEEEFARRIPRAGGILHAQLEIWKLTYSDDCHKNANGGEIQLNDWNEPSIPATFKNEMEEDTEDEDHFLPNPINNSTGNISITDPNKSNCHYFNNEEISTNTDVPVQVPPIKRPGARNGGSHIHLWQFLKELLAAPHVNGTAIRWIDRTKGIFKIEDSVRVAKLWGKRKNRPAMNYDKLSRSIRQYYKKGIMKKTERSQRLVYQFCQPYHM